MRLQCRVTPAHSELLKQLEAIPESYRSKRLIELANMMAMMLAHGNVAMPQQVVIQPAQRAAEPSVESESSGILPQKTQSKQDSEEQANVLPVAQDSSKTHEENEEQEPSQPGRQVPSWLRRSSKSGE